MSFFDSADEQEALAFVNSEKYNSAETQSRHTPLTWAVHKDWMSVAGLIIEKGNFNGEFVAHGGTTALMALIEKQRGKKQKSRIHELVAMNLIRSGHSNPGGLNASGQTAIMLASRLELPNVALALAQTGEAVPVAHKDKTVLEVGECWIRGLIPQAVVVELVRKDWWILAKMREVCERNGDLDAYDGLAAELQRLNRERFSVKKRKRADASPAKKEGEGWDPIGRSFVSVQEWLGESADNIVIEAGGESVCTKKGYYFRPYADQTENFTALECVETHGVFDFGKSRAGKRYVRLSAGGMDLKNGVIEYDSVADPHARVYRLRDTGEKVSASDSRSVLYNPMSYSAKEKNEHFGLGLRSEYVNESKIAHHLWDFSKKEKDTLRMYSHLWDQGINRYLREKKMSPDFDEKKYIETQDFLDYYPRFGSTPKIALANLKSRIAILDSAFAHAPVSQSGSRRIVVYRGTKTDVPEGINYAFVSTSFTFMEAVRFAGGKCCMYELVLKTGTPYIPVKLFSSYEDEDEILLPRNLVFTKINEKVIRGISTVVLEVRMEENAALQNEYHKNRSCKVYDVYRLAPATKGKKEGGRTRRRAL